MIINLFFILLDYTIMFIKDIHSLGLFSVKTLVDAQK